MLSTILKYFSMRHILTATQFTLQELNEILNQAQEMDNILEKGGSEMAKGKILGALFYEPSTRTRLSFETAMHRLGGSVISETDVKSSSVTKGEVLADSIRIVSSYTDIIALRSCNAGDAQLAAEYSSVPILNAGDGAGQHPTQALLDVYTMRKQFDFESPLTISFVGDLKYGRTVHSLCEMLRIFGNFKINFVAPKILQIPEKYIQKNDQLYTELSKEVLTESDIIYDTRIQKERFESESDFETIKNTFIFDRDNVGHMKEKAILLHPLPRVNEITQDVDALPQAKYFEQARNGVPLRMALIARGLGLL